MTLITWLLRGIKIKAEKHCDLFKIIKANMKVRKYSKYFMDVTHLILITPPQCPPSFYRGGTREHREAKWLPKDTEQEEEPALKSKVWLKLHPSTAAVCSVRILNSGAQSPGLLVPSPEVFSAMETWYAPLCSVKCLKIRRQTKNTTKRGTNTRFRIQDMPGTVLGAEEGKINKCHPVTVFKFTPRNRNGPAEVPLHSQRLCWPQPALIVGWSTFLAADHVLLFYILSTIATPRHGSSDGLSLHRGHRCWHSRVLCGALLALKTV